MFDRVEYSANISESATHQQVHLLTVHATDSDGSFALSEVTYSIPEQPCSSLFMIDPQVGSIKIVQVVDFEVGPTECQLTVSATDPLGLSSSSTVYVQFTDSNEFRPVVVSELGHINISVHEALTLNATAFQFKAVDGDGNSLYGAVTNFSLVSMSPYFPFKVSSSGELLVVQRLHRGEVYSFEIFAVDGGGLESEGVSVRVNVTHANYYPPEIITPDVSVELEENYLPARPVVVLNATDEDGDEVSYQVTSGPEELLRVNRSHGNQANIWLNNPLDFEVAETYRFEITAFDGFHRSTPTVLAIRVLPVNEHRPVFTETFMEVEIYENQPPFSYQIPIAAVDFDKGGDAVNASAAHGSIMQFFFVQTSSRFFTIMNQTEDGSAVVTNNQILDYELVFGLLNVTVQARDGGGLTAAEPLIITFNLLDTNDNAPEFVLTRYQADIPENQAGPILRVSAVDRDSSNLYSMLSYELSATSLFFVEQNGFIHLRRPLDYESDPVEYSFNAIAEDFDGKTDSVSVTITLLDQNEFSPEFINENITIFVPEDMAPNSKFFTLNVTDGDGSEDFGTVANFRADSLPDIFILDVTSGDLLLGSAPLDFESQLHKYQFYVEAMDKGGLTSTATVTVYITDVNEFPPEFQPSTYTISITENILPEMLNTSLVQVYTVDRDSTSFRPTFVLTGGNGHFRIDTDGNIILTAPLDYEETTSYELLVNATEGELTSLQPAVVTVSVVNQNDNPPHFEMTEYTVCVVENSTPTSPIIQLAVEDPDTDLDPLVFQLLPSNMSGFTINSNGEVFLSSPLDYETIQSLNFQVSVTDGHFESQTNARITLFVIGVNDISPSFQQLEYQLFVNENLPPGTRIDFDQPLSATDGDQSNLHINKCVPRFLSPSGSAGSIGSAGSDGSSGSTGYILAPRAVN